MVFAIAMLVGGATVLTIGARAAVRGAGRLALQHDISPFLLGALLFGIDIESLGAAAIAAGRGQTSMAAGEAFGTIVFLFSAAFGAALLLAPKPVEAPSHTMILVPSAALVMGALTLGDGYVTRPEGVVLIGAYLVYIATVMWEDRAPKTRGDEIRREAQEGPGLPPLVLLLGGLVLVYLGATVLVDGGVRVLARTSLAAGFVGAAIIGTLASLDEVFLEVLPIRRGFPELAMGNLFGTVAAFSTGVLGLVALVRPLRVDGAATSAFLAASALYTIVAVGFLVRGRAGRVLGVPVLAVYALWLVVGSRL